MTGARETARRGRCRYCSRTFALNYDGRIRRHSIKGRPGQVCGGSGQVPS